MARGEGWQPGQENVRGEIGDTTLPDKRQQSKIIANIMLGDSQRGPEIMDNNKDDFLFRVARGEIGRDDFRELMLDIRPPVAYTKDKHKPKELFAQLGGNARFRIILSGMMRGTTRGYKSVDVSTLGDFLEICGDPLTLEESGKEDELLAMLPAKHVDSYSETLEDFKKIVYGKRYEYHQQMKLLAEEAKAKHPELAQSRDENIEIIKNIGIASDPRALLTLMRPAYRDVLYKLRDQGVELSKGIEASQEYQEGIAKNTVLQIGRAKLEKVGEDNPLIAAWERSIQQDAFQEVAREKMEAADTIHMTQNNVESFTLDLKGFKVEALAPEAREGLMELLEIRGDEYLGKKLTAGALERNKLLPEFQITIGDQAFWFSSNPYSIDKGRIAVVAYTQSEEGSIVPRSYYRSNSHGVWKYLPGYGTDYDGKINHYAKGVGQESISLPAVFQAALNEITEKEGITLKVDDPELIFAGTAKSGVINKGTFYREMDPEAMRKLDRGSLAGIKDISETLSSQRLLHGDFWGGGKRKVSPEELVLSDKIKNPDYNEKLHNWEQDTELYGRISVEIYPSHDGELKYMFCQDDQGRVWIGGIEDSSELTSIGLRKTWINGGDLTTPAYEYEGSDGGYGNPDMAKGHYVDMWKNYLSKIPIIQEYLVHKEAEQ